MARMPREYRPILLLVCLLLCGGLSGCEVGRTMFEYNSGGTPWLGIDLIPRKRSVSAVDGVQPALVSERKSAGRSVSLADQPVGATFEKKPLRLNLPATPEQEAIVVREVTPDIELSVRSLSEAQF